MMTTRLHMSVTLIIALMLHIGLVMWFERPVPMPFPERPVEPPPAIHVSLLSMISETTSVPASRAIPTPPPEPVPEPSSKPEPVPEPVVESSPDPIPDPVVEPPPEPIPDPVVESLPEPEPVPEPVLQEVLPVEPAETPEPVREPTPQVATESEIAEQASVAFAQYSQLFRAWLEKQKIYPRHAQRQRIEGEGILRILIDRMGRIQNVALEQGTGNRLLDKAALKMAWLSDPFPAIPETDLRRKLEFIVPVVFALR